MRLLINAQIITQKCNAVQSRHEKIYSHISNRKVLSYNKVRAIFVTNEVRCARAEQLQYAFQGSKEINLSYSVIQSCRVLET